MQISSGQRIGLAGPSGAGKSLLMRALTMLDPIDSGKVLWQGASPHANDITRFRAQAMYLPQHATVSQQKASEFLRSPFDLIVHQSKRFDRNRIANWLDQCGLEISILDSPTQRLSGGERQVLALLRCLQLDPLLLLMDEPTAAMDPQRAGKVESLLDQWLQEDASRAMLMISHQEEQLNRMAGSVLRIECGRLLA